MDILRMVDFFFVGPSKTASTWIYQALSEHPAFSLPVSKDIYFFDKFWGRGLEWYEAQFAGCEKNKIWGDFSHDYLIDPISLERIKKYNPAAKIIVCLRNPYDRTESGIRFLQRNGYGFGVVEDLVKKHTELVEGSLYGKNLERLYDIFDKEQVLLLEYEDLSSPEVFLDKIYNFFGVKFHAPTVLNKVVNKAKAARYPKVALTVKKISLLCRKIGLGGVVGVLKMNPVIHKMLYKESPGVFYLNDLDRLYLSTQFDQDIDRLSGIVGRNYSEWKHKK